MKYLVFQIVDFDKAKPMWPGIRLSTTNQKEKARGWCSGDCDTEIVVELPDDCQYRIVPKTELENS